MRICFACGHKLGERLEVFRSTACPSCDRDLKACKNCEFYSPGAHRDCHESIDVSVQDKEKANFCDFFRYRKSDGGQSGGTGEAGGRGGTASTQNKAREAFGKLFGGDE